MLLEDGEIHQRKPARGDGEPYERLRSGATGWRST